MGRLGHWASLLGSNKGHWHKINPLKILRLKYSAHQGSERLTFIKRIPDWWHKTRKIKKIWEKLLEKENSLQCATVLVICASFSQMYLLFPFIVCFRFLFNSLSVPSWKHWQNSRKTWENFGDQSKTISILHYQSIASTALLFLY